MSGKLHLALVFHNHQPVGNFDFVFREAFEKAYRPLVDLLERHPAVRVSSHISGPLRDWLLANERDFYLGRLGALVNRGQVEMISGAYYEPILIMLDDADKIGQTRLLNDALTDDFGAVPGGMWLAERVWEPALAKPIAEAGLRYALVDDTHFHYAGFNDADLHGYYITEEQSHPLNLLPISRQMRYMTPYQPVDAIIAVLRAIHDDPTTPQHPLVVNADDGEKFGLWPGSYRLCWEEGWMETFFSRLEAESDWLTTTTPGTYINSHYALGRAYLPTASYLEMTTWALPAGGAAELPGANAELTRAIQTANAVEPAAAERLRTAQRYLRGGLWRNFLVKYPEINHMQKRGVYIGRRVHALPAGDDKTHALRHLWAAQCNCGYWHGLFGGIYLFHIRAANYANLLAAHALTLDADVVEVETADFDMDTRDELLINATPFSLVVDLPRGGALREWDDMPAGYNLLNVMTRHQEGYHLHFAEAIARNNVITPADPDWDTPGIEHIRAKESGLDRHLVVDQHRRGSLVDHFFDAELTLDAYSHAKYSERGDFVQGAYTAAIHGVGTPCATVTLSREGQVFHKDGWHPLTISKTLTIEAGARVLPVQYTLTNTGDHVLDLHFGVETVYGFDGGDSHYCYFEWTDDDDDTISENLGHSGVHTPVTVYTVGTRIRGFEVRVESDHPAALWRFPLAPVTMSESGYERVHQGAVFLHRYRVALQPGAAWTLGLRFSVDAIS